MLSEECQRETAHISDDVITRQQWQLIALIIVFILVVFALGLTRTPIFMN